MPSRYLPFMRPVLRILIFTTLVMGCVSHGPAIPALPSKGGPAWLEVTSDHFVLWTDSSRERGHELVQDMERHRQVVLGVALGGADSAAKSFVIALRDAEEVGAYVPKEFIAYSWAAPTAVWQPIVIVAADTKPSDVHIFTHELTHVITRAVVANQPFWFAEGLAGYFETAKIDASRGTVDVGQPLDYVVERLRTRHPTPAAALFACVEHTCMDDMYYATTWALFSFLVNQHPAELARYTQRLAQLGRGQEDRAWGEVFPSLLPAALDHELAEWLAHGQRIVVHYKLKLETRPTHDRSLGDGDALAARGILRYLFSKDSPETRGELEAALAADPTNLIARLVMTALTHSIGVREAKETAAAHPDDWRAWWLLGFAAERGPDAQEAHDKLCALVANGPPAELPVGFCAARP